VPAGLWLNCGRRGADPEIPSLDQQDFKHLSSSEEVPRYGEVMSGFFVESKERKSKQKRRVIDGTF